MRRFPRNHKARHVKAKNEARGFYPVADSPGYPVHLVQPDSASWQAQICDLQISQVIDLGSIDLAAADEIISAR